MVGVIPRLIPAVLMLIRLTRTQVRAEELTEEIQARPVTAVTEVSHGSGRRVSRINRRLRREV